VRETHTPRPRLTAPASLFAALILTVTTACAGPAPADLVVVGGRVVTVDDARPEAGGIAVRGHEIVAVGSDARIRRFIGEGTRTIELDGRLAIPGFIEGHGHFTSLGQAMMVLDLNTARRWEDIVAMVAEAARNAAPGEWILGRGWHQEKWESVPEPSVEGVPTHRDLSRAAPHNPVDLGHASGHAALVNARALELAGIDRNTPDPPGGEIVRDARGEPTGLLRETAQRIVDRVYAHSRESMTAADREAEFRQIIELATDEALAKGITSFHDAGSSLADIDRLRAMEAAGDLRLRLYVMVRYATNEEMEERLDDYLIIPEGNDHLAVRCIKRQIDGALGAHGAWLLDPYEDLPTSVGLNLEPVEDIAGTCELAIRHGFQVATHAIGDRGNRETLDLYSAAFSAAGVAGEELRWRIEHSQHLHPDDVPRFARLGVIAAMQGVHCTSDGPWVIKRLGERRAEEGAYLWRTLWDLGVVVTNGTDVPVEDIDPIAGYYSTITRHCFDGSIFYPEECLTREEALRSYTLNNAFAAFEDHLKGSLEPGKLADITVLSDDILALPAEQIPSVTVDYTIVGGTIAYAREGDR